MVSIVSISALIGSGLDLRGSVGAIADELAQEGIVTPVVKAYHFEPRGSLLDLDGQRDYVTQAVEWATGLVGALETDGVGIRAGDEIHAFVIGPISFVVQVGRMLKQVKASVIVWNRLHDGSWVRLPPAGHWLGQLDHFTVAGWQQCLDTSGRDIHLGFSARTADRDGQCLCIDAVEPDFRLLAQSSVRAQVTSAVEEMYEWIDAASLDRIRLFPAISNGVALLVGLLCPESLGLSVHEWRGGQWDQVVHTIPMSR